MIKIPKTILYCTASVAALLFAGCASAPKEDPAVFTDHALAATDPKTVKGLGKGSPVESEAIARFKHFNQDFSEANISNNTATVYAQDLWFRDPFKEIRGEPAFQAYLLRGSSATKFFSIEWKDLAESDGNYYFRWIMRVKLKRDGKHKPPSITPGISMVRFGADGKVIFQQDYYDGAAFLYERIPILRSEIRFIKKRL
jgi:steroid delta-isomerase